MLKRILPLLLFTSFLTSCGSEDSSEPIFTCTSFDCHYKISLHILILNEIFITTCLDPIEDSYSCEKPDPYVTVKLNDDLIYQTPVYNNTRVIEFEKQENPPPSFETFVGIEDVFEIQLFDYDENIPDTLVITCRDTLSQEILDRKRIFCQISGLNHTVVFKIEPLR